jgi:RNA polymerase sigma factor (sigma-70 family)
MRPDSELLRLYIEKRSEGAFAELVGRHLRMVHSCALRRVGGDKHLADDVTQIVFNDLARKARRLVTRPTLSGWLYVSAQKTSAGVVRQERRRKSRDLKASELHVTPTAPGPTHGADWTILRPLLDSMILALKHEERDAVVLRYFEKHSFAEIGSALQSSEDAIRKRVERAVGKLRIQLERRGLTSTTDALEFALEGQVEAQPPREELPGKVAAIAITEFAATGTATTLLLSLIRVLTSDIAVSGAALLGIVLILSHQISKNSGLRAEISHLNGSEGAARAALKNENRRLEDALRQDMYELGRRSVVSSSGVEAAHPEQGRLSVPLHLIVSAEGTLRWEQERVTLQGFLDKLVAFEEQHPGPDAQVIVHGEAGSSFSSTAYVVEQASKAGIQDIIVDTQTRPTASDIWTFSPQLPIGAEHDVPPPSLPDPPVKP